MFKTFSVIRVNPNIPVIIIDIEIWYRINLEFDVSRSSMLESFDSTRHYIIKLWLKSHNL